MLSQNQKRNKLYTSFLELCKNSNMTLKDIVHMGCQLMKNEKIHPHFFQGNSLLATAQYLTFYALQLPHEYENKHYLNLTISEITAQKIIILFEKRIAERLPVAYITNETWYLGNQFYVNENVLVPRSAMNYRFDDFLNNTHWENNRILDLCTGSGCIGISLALLRPEIEVDLVDISSKALEVATININNHSLQKRVHCIQSDLFQNIQGKYDLIISNPPYVSTAEYNAAPDEFKNEPKLALECGLDGLDLIHKIIVQAQPYLNPNGTLIAEVGTSAAKRLKRKYPKIPFQWFKYRRPNGSESWFAMDCIFACKASGLP